MIQEKYPCLLLVNDLHVGKENIPEFMANWNEALAICEKMGIAEIVVGGDLFLSRAAQNLDILLAVHDVLLCTAEKGIRVVLANGNHDKVSLEANRGYCHIFDQYRNVLVADTFVTLPVGGGEQALLHLIPYFPENGSFCEKLEAVKRNAVDASKKNFLYIHEGINGALSQPGDKELPVTIFEGFERVFVAHYHNRCVIPKTCIEYIGSSRQHNFGETEGKGYTVLFNDGSHEFVPNTVNIRYKTIDIDADQVDIHLTDLLEDMKSVGRYRTRLRIHANSTQPVNIDKERFLDAGASKVEIITEDTGMREVYSSGLFEKFDRHKIRMTYEAFCRDKGIEDVETGLSYLSKIVSACGS